MFTVSVIVISNAAAQATTFEITDTKLNVPLVTLSNHNSAKLSQQLESGLKGTIN